MSISNLYPSIAPSLSLDFANVGALDPRITFVRTTTATYYGTETAKSEENLLIRSQEFDNAAWSKNNVTVTANTEAAPDGTTTAETLDEGVGASTNHMLSRNPAVVASTQYTVSVYAKDVDSGYVFIAIRGAANNVAGATFNLTSGTVENTHAIGTGFSVDATSIVETPAGSGWYRCVVTLTVGTTISGQAIHIGMSDGSAITNSGFPLYTGTDKQIFLWGAQVEQRSAVTNYTPTTTQPITNYIPVLEVAAAGEARFDHNPLTFESLGLLIEEQRTNLILQSEDLDTTWSETRSTLSLNSVVSPSGSLTADVLIANTDNNTHFTSQTFTGTAASHTFTVYAKASGLNHVALRLFNGTSQVGLAYYNLSTGATGTVTAGTAAITSVGNGFFRCSLTATLVASASCTADIQLANADNTNSFAGNAFSGVTLWGTQVELGAFATSYIQTVAATVTRNADAATMTGANFSSWYNQAEGTFFVDAEMYQVQFAFFRILLSASSTSGINRAEFTVPANSSNMRFTTFSSGVTAGTTQASITLGSTFKAAGSYKTNDIGVSFNGASALTTTTGLAPADVNQLFIGNVTGTGVGIAASTRIKKISFYPSRLSNAQLQALTTV